MKRNRWRENPVGLEPLAAQARDNALHMMKTTGSVPPTVIAGTEEGFVFCMPSALADDAAKDRFAEVAKLFAVAYRAQALVMIVEADLGQIWGQCANLDKMHPDLRFNSLPEDLRSAPPNIPLRAVTFIPFAKSPCVKR